MIKMFLTFEEYCLILQKLIKKSKSKIQMMKLNEYLFNAQENYLSLSFAIETGQYKSKIAISFEGKKAAHLLHPQDIIVATWLNKKIKRLLLTKVHQNAYAYIEGRSRFQAIDKILEKKENLSLKELLFIDIKNFFRDISKEVLLNKIKRIGIENKLLKILEENIYIKYIKNGEISYIKGLVLGHPLSPILSNVFMYEFDCEMSKIFDLYVRFSDDIAVGDFNGIGDNNMKKINKLIQKEGLNINENKAKLVKDGDKHTYLGHTIYINNNIENNIAKYMLKIIDTINKEVLNESQLLLYIIAYIWINKNCQINTSKLFNEEIKKELIEKSKIENVLDYIDGCIKIFVLKGLYAYGDIIEKFSKLIEENIYTYRFKENIFIKLKELGLFEYETYSGSFLNNQRQYTLISKIKTYEELVRLEESGQSIAIKLYDELSKICVIDIDINKKVLSNENLTDIMFKSLLEQGKLFARTIQSTLKENNIYSTLIFSGRRGYHLWIFFETEELLNNSIDNIVEIINGIYKPVNISYEIIPLMPNNNIIRIPCTIHEITKKRGQLLDDFESSFIINKKSLKLEHNKEILKVKKVNEIKSIEEVSKESKEIIDNCDIINELVNKAISTNYLNHFERNALLYVLGHVKSDGKALIHYIISKCINYDETITEAFIDKLQNKPVSCHKLKLRFPEFSEKCNCDFSKYKLYYPSPVIWGLKVNENAVTKPDYIDKNKRIEEIQILTEKQKIEKLSSMLFAKLQEKHKINKEIEQCKKELDAIFTNNNIRSYNISTGKLVKIGDDWVIELN